MIVFQVKGQSHGWCGGATGRLYLEIRDIWHPGAGPGGTRDRHGTNLGHPRDNPGWWQPRRQLSGATSLQDRTIFDNTISAVTAKTGDKGQATNHQHQQCHSTLYTVCAYLQQKTTLLFCCLQTCKKRHHWQRIYNVYQ